MKAFARSSDGVSVCYETHGAGSPALVLVHGWSCDRSYWREQTGHFAARHEVVAVDLAGHGESGSERSDWTMAAFGDDVVAVVEELGHDRVVLVGHSMGGDVVTEAALRLPGRAIGVVWVDTYGALGNPITHEELDAFAAPFREDFVGATRALMQRMFPPGADPELVEWVASDASAAPQDIAIPALLHARGNDGRILDHLSVLTAPVVALNPDDGSTDVEGLRRHAVESVLMPGVGHFLMLEDPAGFNSLLGSMIERFTT